MSPPVIPIDHDWTFTVAGYQFTVAGNSDWTYVAFPGTNVDFSFPFWGSIIVAGSAVILFACLLAMVLRQHPQKDKG